MPNRTLSETNFGLRMPAELRNRATEIAAARGRTLAGEIRWQLMQLVAAQDAAELEVARRGGGLLDPLPDKRKAPAGDGRLADDRVDGRHGAER